MLDDLRRELAFALEREQQALLNTNPAESNVVIARHGLKSPIGLGEHPTVSFLDKVGGDWMDAIDVRPDDNGIYVTHISGRIAVLPESGNVVRIVGRR